MFGTHRTRTARNLAAKGWMMFAVVYFIIIMCYHYICIRNKEWLDMGRNICMACAVVLLMHVLSSRTGRICRSTKRNCTFIFLAVVLSRLALFYLLRIEPISDYEFYMIEASKFAQTGKFDATQYIVVVAPNTVMYIIVLGTLFRLFGCSLLVAQIFNMILLAGSCVILYLIGTRFVKKHMAMLAALGFAFMPSVFLYSLLIGTEYIALFPLTLGMYAVLKATEQDAGTKGRGWAVFYSMICGISLAVSNINRSNALVSLIAVIIWLTMHEVRKGYLLCRRLSILLVILLSFGAVSSGYSAIRDHLFQGRGSQTSLGWTMFEGLDLESAGDWTEEKSRVLFDVRENYPEEEVQGVMLELAMERVAGYSFSEWVEMFLRKGVNTWGYDDYPLGFVGETSEDSIIQPSKYGIHIVRILDTVWWIHLMACMLSMIYYIFKVKADSDSGRMMLLIVPVVLLIIWHSFATSIPRYHYMIVPFTLLLTLSCIEKGNAVNKHE